MQTQRQLWQLRCQQVPPYNRGTAHQRADQAQHHCVWYQLKVVFVNNNVPK
jgi:hypothetical protein